MPGHGMSRVLCPGIDVDSYCKYLYKVTSLIGRTSCPSVLAEISVYT